MPAWILAMLEQLAPIILQTIVTQLTPKVGVAAPEEKVQERLEKHQAALKCLIP